MRKAIFGDTSIPLPDTLVCNMNARSKAKFGIRPENISLIPGGDSVAVEATVVITEPLGAETLVTFQVGNTELVVRCPADFAMPPGSKLPIHLSKPHMHVFDAETGLALR